MLELFLGRYSITNFDLKNSWLECDSSDIIAENFNLMLIDNYNF